MKRIAGTAAALALSAGGLTAGGLAVIEAPAHADPGFMGHAEWSAVNEGETKANVEANCACTGVKNGFTANRNGNSYTDFFYQSQVGEAFVYYRIGSDGKWHVGYKKFWCPGDTLGQETGDCSFVDFG